MVDFLYHLNLAASGAIGFRLKRKKSVSVLLYFLFSATQQPRISRLFCVNAPHIFIFQTIIFIQATFEVPDIREAEDNSLFDALSLYLVIQSCGCSRKALIFLGAIRVLINGRYWPKAKFHFINHSNEVSSISLSPCQ